MRMVRSCCAGVGSLEGAAFTSSSLILSVSWATRDFKYASSSDGEPIADDSGDGGGGRWLEEDSAGFEKSTQSRCSLNKTEKSGGLTVRSGPTQ
jgi:hypothetical protein